MKNFILMVLAGMVLTTVSLAEEGGNLYPLDFKVQPYLEEIHYGDVCFLLFSVTNQGSETLLLPYGKGFFDTTRGALYCEQRRSVFPDDGERWILPIGNYFVYEELWGETRCSVWEFPGRPVKPGETMVFHIKPLWIPWPEFADRDNAIELRKVLEKGEKEFQLRFYVNYRWAYATARHPQRDANGQLLNEDDLEGLTMKQLAEKRPEYPYEANSRGYHQTIECSLRILPRSPANPYSNKEVPGPKEVLLIQEWFLELPEVWPIISGVFAHPYHARDSPFKMPYATPWELILKRRPLYEDYIVFYEPLETRTPESLARVERANELASQIIERSKQPDSTISQNMMEFVQLRSFLVDVFYAEDVQAEQTAFEKLMDFIDTAKDRKLWIKFLDETGLYDILNDTFFPQLKLGHYRELFAKRFPEVKTLD